MSNKEKVIKLLNDVLFSGGVFDVEAARTRLNAFKETGEITALEYMHFWDTCNCYNDDGHYRNSILYKRAIQESI